MRIAYIADTPIPSRAANSIQVMKMCAAFSRKHATTLIVPRQRETAEPAGDVFSFYGVGHTFRLARYRPWPFRRGAHRVNGWLALAAAARHGVDLVYSRSLLASGQAAACGYRTVFEAHRFVGEGRGRSILRRLAKRSNFERLVVISDALRRAYSDAFPELADRIVTAHDAADAPLRTNPPAGLDQPTSVLRVGYVGHLYPGKGMELIAAMAPRCPSAEFHVVGGTAQDIAHWQSILSSVGNIRFHGYVPHRETPGYLQAFDVVLAPYGRRVETFGSTDDDISRWMSPLKIFEYMAAGRAIICSDLPVLREVLDEGKTALFCSPDAVEPWCAAIDELAGKPHLRAALGEAARATFLREHTWQARAELVLRGLPGQAGDMIGERAQAAGWSALQ
jgi:glycosyltransferase involved in cell wall biosynthesis